MVSFGLIPSGFDERDHKISAQSNLPASYNLSKIINVQDQGPSPTCAAITLLTILNWNNSIKGKSFKCSDRDIFNLREPKTLNGMIPRQALKALKNEGVCGEKINAFAKIDTVEAAKTAILLNGPVMLGTNAYSDSDQFWRPTSTNLGGHATTLIGWDQNGFILQNSWGYQWGNAGRTYFPFTDWRYVLECWTIML